MKAASSYENAFLGGKNEKPWRRNISRASTGLMGCLWYGTREPSAIGQAYGAGLLLSLPLTIFATLVKSLSIPVSSFDCLACQLFRAQSVSVQCSAQHGPDPGLGPYSCYI